MERPLIVLSFKVFLYIIDDNSCLKCCIFTKLNILLIYTVLYLDIPEVTASYGRLSDLNEFLGFSNIITCFKRNIFIKLSQIDLR